MINKIKNLILASLSATLFIASSSFANNTDWAQQDLQFIHDAIRDNHPGMYNEYDPFFERYLVQQYKKAHDQLQKAVTYEEKMEATRTFLQSFDDAHLHVGYYKDPQKQYTAPTKQKNFGIEHIGHMCWITLPTFNAKEEKYVQSLQTITDTLAKKQSVQPFASDDVIVFDIRGNDSNNGDYSFAYNIVQALFGQEYMNYYMNKVEQRMETVWRASKGNIDYLRAMIEHERSKEIFYYQEPAWIKKYYHVIDGMEEALLKGKPYFTQKNGICDVTQIKPINLCKAPIIVIIDKDCCDAALTFIDYLKSMNHPMTLCGKTTGSDLGSCPSDTKILPLPSGRGFLEMPITIVRNAIRNQNEAYIPDIAYYEDMHDTPKMLAFVVNNLLPHLDKLIMIKKEIHDGNGRKTSKEFLKIFERYIRISMRIAYGDRFKDGDRLVEKIIAQALDLKETTNSGLDEAVAFAINLFKVAHDIDQVDSCYYLCRTLVGMCGQSMDQALDYMQQYAQTFPPVCLFGSASHINGYEKNYCTYLVPAIKMITKNCPESTNLIIQKAIKLCKIGVTQKDAVRFATVVAHAGADDAEYIKYQYHLYYAAAYCLKKDAGEALKLILRCAMPMMTQKEFLALLQKVDYKEPWWTIAPAAPTLLNLFPDLILQDLIAEDEDAER